MDRYLQRKQRGFSLTEALVAFVVITGGLLAVASFQSGLFANSAYNKARTEALALAQQKIEEFKHYTHADQDNYIDANADGVMDGDGSYTDNPIPGQNAVFQRGWDVSTGNDGKRVDVTVSWLDADNDTQSVMLAASLPWISPRSGADQLATRDPSVFSPTGRARLDDGNLADYPDGEITPVSSPGPDGLATYQHNETLFLVDPYGNILLALEKACSAESGVCTDFVRISGTVYRDIQNAKAALGEINVTASDAAHCERWVESGTLSSPPSTATGDYEYYHYTCYLGGGWHGNIGFVTTRGLSASEKACQGDPTSLNPWEEPTVALRRVYRGMLHRDYGGETLYYTHGIKDAAVLTGQDFVFTELDSAQLGKKACEGPDAPMTRDDSYLGRLFKGVPVEFFCLNTDDDNDSSPDYLDAYDSAVYAADTNCPYDPTTPPIQSYTISGVVSILSADALDPGSVELVTSDGGPGNCEWVNPLAATADGHEASFACTVYDWGNGWTGFVQVQPRSQFVYCPSDTADFTAINADQSHYFGCISANTVAVAGSISHGSNSSISSIAISDALTGFEGVCHFDDMAYRCVLPYDGNSVDVALTVTSKDYVCGSVDGVFTSLGRTFEGSPYRKDIALSGSSSGCPILN